MQSDSTPDRPLCACGCGNRLPPQKQPRPESRFLRGHQARTPLVRCQKCNEHLPRVEFDRINRRRADGAEIEVTAYYCRACMAESRERAERIASEKTAAEARRQERQERIARHAAEREAARQARQEAAAARPRVEDLDLPLCGCGCGECVNVPERIDRIAKYLPGHHLRMSPVPYIVNEETGCWEWQRSKHHGYGRLVPPGETVPRQAHRVYYEQAKGPIPEGMQLDHLCRNRACVNPDHLEPVTQTENVRRGAAPRLSLEAADRIRSLKGVKTGRELAREYGVSSTSIYEIWNGRAWVHDETSGDGLELGEH